MTNRITPPKVSRLDSDQVFGFASNLQGKHGAGGAKQAMKWGAVWGVGHGLRGQTYAIPTRNWLGWSPGVGHNFETLPIDVIKVYVEQYIFDCKLYDDRIFLTSAIGCGHAGYKAVEMAPLFDSAIKVDNIWLPQAFWNVLGGIKSE